MLLVGLTGGIGAGKSTVAEMLQARGAVVLDADAVAREVVAPGTPGLKAIVERFGAGVLGPEGALDRPALAAVAFATDEAREALEGITHPAIQEEFTRRISEAPPESVLVLDVPLLAESESVAKRGYEVVIVVEAPREVRLDRLEERGVPRADAEARMAAQATDEQRRKLATHVIDNSSDRAHLESQVDTLWSDLQARQPSP
ncbi:MAG TPA: dephospho-CoA kinase [Acidimicrobiia bacterium]|jgi:dephospho-CoA kinase